MTQPMPLTEPRSVTAGDTAQWRVSLPQYPASAGWVLHYVLINATHKLTFQSQPSGADHLVSLGASVTAAWQAGGYAWEARAVNGALAHTVRQGRMEVRPNLAIAATADMRGFARRTLEAVEAYMADPTNLAAAKYSIAGRSLDRIPLADLMAHRDRLRFEVLREDAAQSAAAGLAGRGRVLVRFGA